MNARGEIESDPRLEFGRWLLKAGTELARLRMGQRQRELVKREMRDRAGGDAGANPQFLNFVTKS